MEYWIFNIFLILSNILAIKMNGFNPKVDTFISNAKKWQPELELLRNILLDCGLTEEFKWRQPCYAYQKTNILIIGEFKDCCVLSFFKGVLLNDTHQILVKPGDNSQSVRMIKFTNVKQIYELEEVLKEYIFEAIEVEKAGLKVVLNNHEDLRLVEELQEILNKNLPLKVAFDALTPGRQRGYNMFFAAAKQSQTRIARVEKYIGRIMSGKGINDCVCGFSKKMPTCDGSHKFI